MTAEIVIMNKHGVALAADSAVSIGSSKVYNSANKLFALSKRYPVGIMIYGSADFMDTPWETVIKYYRSTHLKNKHFETLQDYYFDFIEFLQSTTIFPKDSEARYFIRVAVGACTEIKTLINDKIKSAFNHGEGVDENTVRSITKESIKQIRDHSATLTQSVLFARSNRDEVLNSHESSLSNVISRIFENLYIDTEDRDGIANIILNIIGCCDIEHEQGHTGIVIAGYGEKEIFPCMAAMRIQGRLGNYLRLQHVEDNESEPYSASISPFAQREMVDMFMCGADPEITKHMISSFDEVVRKIPELLVEKLNYNIDAENELVTLRSEIESFSKTANSKIAEFQNNNYIQPILASVNALPLDELASMAESLVNLTSFKRRVTMVQESVGGPIDVAVISKGDGLIWIKRKHYFSSELNHHYFSNLSRDDNGHRNQPND
uniref:hypothetical protein n=1 Tax=Castellaniella defragrans TaxID=75697 RepID=UPI003340C902